MTDEAAVPVDKAKDGSISGEAINGIAASGMSLAVSSRREITLRTWTAANPERITVSGVPHGAHGIIVTPSGNFLAPLGRDGVMIIRPNSRPNDPVGVLTGDRDGLVFYRVIAIPRLEGRDLLVCATRQGGMGITEIQWGQDTYNMKLATFAGLDVVDVCAISGPPDTPAIAGIGREGTLLLVRDALNDEHPVTIKFSSVLGTAYRLLSARGHVFVLTSCGLYGLMNLGDRLVKGLITEQFTTPILVVAVEAVDANLVDDRWLLVTMPDEVLKFDLDLIDQNIPDARLNGQFPEAIPETLTPNWKVRRLTQRSRQLAGAV
jgi:hypothetical protein